MSDIEDFLMSHIEPILRRAQKPVETSDTKLSDQCKKPDTNESVSKPYLTIRKESVSKPYLTIRIVENNEKDLINNEMKKLEFYNDNLYKLNKKIEKQFKIFQSDCIQCPCLNTQACEDAIKKRYCPKYW